MEIFIFSISLIKYLKHKHFKSRVILAKKISQSLFLTSFLIITTFLNYSKSSEPRSTLPVSRELQYSALFILIVGLAMELFFTFLLVLSTVYDQIKYKKLLKKMSKVELEKEKEKKMNNGIIKYIYPETSKITKFTVQNKK